MNKRTWLWFSITLFFVVWWTIPNSLAQPNPKNYVLGEVLLTFSDKVSPSVAGTRLNDLSVSVLAYSPQANLVRVQVPIGDEAAMIDTLSQRADVAYVGYNYYIQAQVEPDDPYYQNGTQWALSKIDASTAWQLSSSGKGVTIAIADSGLDLYHEEFTQTIIITGPNYVNPNTLPLDDYGHGTHVAGIIAATANNGVGVAGVSGQAKIMPLKVLDHAGDGKLSSLVDAVYYAVDQGADIINMSIGIKGSKWPCEADITPLAKAFEYADQHGVLLVGASGNANQNGVYCPATLDTVIAVGSTTRFDGRSGFSNYGDRLDVVAPGSSIYSTKPNSYGSLNGTSMATPHVSGLAALIWSFRPDLTHTEVRQIIETTVDDLGEPGKDEFFGWGRINAGRALRELNKLEVSVSQTRYLMGDNTSNMSLQEPLSIKTYNRQAIVTWTATISPEVSWLRMVSEITDTVSYTDPSQLLLEINRPTDYTLETTTLYVDAGPVIGATMIDFELQYVPHVHKYYLPIIKR